MSQSDRLQKQWVFLNESGTRDGRDLAGPGASQHFILVAVLVADGDLASLRAQLETLLRIHKALPPQAIGSDDAKRVAVLEALAELPFRFLATAIDRAELSRRAGSIYGESYHGSICSFLYGKLRRSLHDLETVAGERIDRGVMSALGEHVHRRHPTRELFVPRPRFAKDSDEVMLQVADLIADTLARCIDPTRPSPRAAEFRRVLDPLELETLCWPPDQRWIKRAHEPLATAHDRTIRRLALNRAFQYLIEHAHAADEIAHARVATVRYLLYREQVDDPSVYIATRKLLDVLQKNEGVALSVHQLRTSVIGPLRDADLLIASSEKGYKLPSAASDVHEFFARASHVVEPIIRRVRAANSQIALATDDHVDLLADERHAELRRLTRAYSG
jgi:hypothetical protein